MVEGYATVPQSSVRDGMLSPPLGPDTSREAWCGCQGPAGEGASQGSGGPAWSIGAQQERKGVVAEGRDWLHMGTPIE